MTHPTVTSTPEDVPFLDVKDAAAFLGMSADATYRAIEAGQIPSIRVGRKIRVPSAALKRMANPDQ